MHSGYLGQTPKHKGLEMGNNPNSCDSVGTMPTADLGQILEQEDIQDVNNSDQNKHELYEDRSDSSDEYVAMCDLCRSHIVANTEWFRCTECTEMDMCGPCWKTGEHIQHASQVHQHDSQALHFDKIQFVCSSCGFCYDHNNPQFKVWMCTECGDYSLCKKCKSEDMHRKHNTKLKLKLLSQYVEYV